MRIVKIISMAIILFFSSYWILLSYSETKHIHRILSSTARGFNISQTLFTGDVFSYKGYDTLTQSKTLIKLRNSFDTESLASLCDGTQTMRLISRGSMSVDKLGAPRDFLSEFSGMHEIGCYGTLYYPSVSTNLYTLLITTDVTVIWVSTD
jgi:hypothetical protein